MATCLVTAACGGGDTGGAPDAATSTTDAPSSADATISAARMSAAGTEVTFQGTVTVPSGVYEAFTGDKGFALQDESGGVYVAMTESASLEEGTLVQVTGTVGALDGMLVVNAELAQVKALGAGAAVAPIRVPTGEVGAESEGLLITITGNVARQSQADGSRGYLMFVNDGTGEVQALISATIGFNPTGVPFLNTPGSRVGITGLSGRSQDVFMVYPRKSADIGLAQ